MHARRVFAQPFTFLHLQCKYDSYAGAKPAPSGTVRRTRSTNCTAQVQTPPVAWVCHDTMYMSDNISKKIHVGYGHPSQGIKIALKTQTHAGQPGPRRPAASFQSGRKKRTQRSPARGPRTQCGPSAPPRTRGVISASLEGSPSKPSTTPRASASLEGSEPTLGEADRLPLARG